MRLLWRMSWRNSEKRYRFMRNLLSIILGLMLLFPLSASAKSRDALAGRKDVTTNRTSNNKVTIKYEYLRLVRFYLYNDGHIDHQEQIVLKLLEQKWRISPKEVESIIQEAKKTIK